MLEAISICRRTPVSRPPTSPRAYTAESNPHWNMVQSFLVPDIEMVSPLWMSTDSRYEKKAPALLSPDAQQLLLTIRFYGTHL